MNTPSATLAMADAWTIALFVINLVVGVLVAWLLYRERAREARIVRLEQNLEHRAEQLIEARLSGVASHLEGVINVVNERVTNIRDRLKAGDNNFADLDKRDRELEARFNLRFEQLKDYLHEHFATKQDVADVRRQVHQIQTTGRTA